MKRIQNKLYLGLVIIGLTVPLQVHAAGRDSVMLGLDENQVAVSLEMSNAAEEKITTVAVSIEVKTEDPGQITVGFQFAPELSGTEHGFIYNENTGRLDIYVASSKSLFSEENLNLGNVQVQLTNPEQSVLADISYCKNSFQTANSSYGDKAPVVEGEAEAIRVQVGNGTLTPVNPDNDSSGTGSVETKPGNNNGGNAGNSTGSDGSNRDQGLYDDTTRFTNDPSSAQKIDSSIVKRDKNGNLLPDLSTGVTAAIAGKNKTNAGNIGHTKAKGKVSVISPENGPSSILVSKGNNGISDGNSSDSLLSGENGENAGGSTDGIMGSGTTLEDGSEEIMLDQENGGAADNRKGEQRKQIVIVAASAGMAAAAGSVIFLLIKKMGYSFAGVKKKRRRRRRKKRPVNRRKQPAGRSRKAARRRKQPADRSRESVRRGKKSMDGKRTPRKKPVKRKRKLTRRARE